MKMDLDSEKTSHLFPMKRNQDICYSPVAEYEVVISRFHDIFLTFVVHKYTLADNEENPENLQRDLGEEIPEESIPHFPEQVKKLKEKSAEIVEDKNPVEPSTIKHEPDNVRKNKLNRALTEGRGSANNFLTRKAIVTLSVIIAIVIIGVVLYTVVQSSNQSYKVENYNSQWNASLLDLRNGNVSMTDYCNTRVHDQKLCDQYWDLKYMN
jgi:hypothetical protein